MKLNDACITCENTEWSDTDNIHVCTIHNINPTEDDRSFDCPHYTKKVTHYA